MEKTSLYHSHLAQGAKMISFGGWEMPRDYGNGVVSEVNACRATAGLFDVSHMGEFRIRGGEALAFVQHVTTNDATRLRNSKAQYSLMLNEAGGVKDDVIVYRDGPNDYLVVVNAGNKAKDWDWLSHQAKSFNARMVDESEQTALIAVQGPLAVSKVESLASVSVDKLRRFYCNTVTIADIPCTLSRTGYTGEDGFELFCCSDDAPKLWSALVQTGAVPCGLAARDVLRLEAAYPLYGHELTESESPLGTGVAWAIKTSKPDFIGREDIIRRCQDGIRERLVGLTVKAANAIPREGQMVFVETNEEPIGRVTSGTLSPTLGKGIALARINAGYADDETELIIDVRGRKVDAQVTSLPFYRGLDN